MIVFISLKHLLEVTNMRDSFKTMCWSPILVTLQLPLMKLGVDSMAQMSCF